MPKTRYNAEDIIHKHWEAGVDGASGNLWHLFATEKRYLFPWDAILHFAEVGVVFLLFEANRVLRQSRRLPASSGAPIRGWCAQ